MRVQFLTLAAMLAATPALAARAMSVSCGRIQRCGRFQAIARITTSPLRNGSVKDAAWAISD